MAEEKALSNEELVALVIEQGKKIEILTGLLTKGSEIKEGAVKEKPATPKDPVKYKGKEYQAQVPAFKIKGVSYTTEQSNADEKLFAQILAIPGQQIYKELV